MAQRVLVKRIEPNLWQWREVSAAGDWHNDAFYTGDINLLKETTAGKPVWFVLNGVDAVCRTVPADIKDRRQLLKILPFEIEEHIITPIEDIHMAYGPIVDDHISVVYGDAELMQECIDEIVGTSADVEHCFVDYLLLPFEPGSWTVLLENGILSVRTGKYEGFAIEQDMAALALNKLLGDEQNLPVKIRLCADDEDLPALRQMLPDNLPIADEAEEIQPPVVTDDLGYDDYRDEDDITVLQEPVDSDLDTPIPEPSAAEPAVQSGVRIEEVDAGFWDLVDPSKTSDFDFRTGRLARKLPFARWWLEWKVPVIAAAAAFVVAVSATWFGQYQADVERKKIVAQTDQIFRQAVPQGTITDPVRQLRALVGSGGESGESSNVMVLISGVAPLVKSFNAVKIKTFRYSLDSRQLQMNIEADSFTTFENLRAKIADAGFAVEIKSATVFGDVHQAQLRISEAG